MPSRSSASMIMEPPSLLQRHRHHELQLQGPRPAPLKVSTSTTGTEMVVVKKRRLHHHQQARQPVIIYVDSPRVVHAHPGEFKSVVQRLTGAAPAPEPSPLRMVFSASPPPPPLQFPFQFPMVGAAGSADAMLPLTSSIVSSSVTVADASGSSSVQENLSSHPFLLPLPSSSSSLASSYHHQYHGGDVFIAHHQ